MCRSIVVEYARNYGGVSDVCRTDARKAISGARCESVAAAPYSKTAELAMRRPDDLLP